MYKERPIEQLVRSGKVSRQIYTNPDIFDLEMERIFGSAWLYVAHESQIPKAGDFVTSRVGLDRVIVARHKDGKINVLHNRCTHRGAEICRTTTGNTSVFTCPYHAWSFRTDGSLAAVPHMKGYGEEFEARMDEFGLERVARVDSYRGFVFASKSPDGPDLDTFLGAEVRGALDNFVDRAPDGEIELAEGKLVQAFRANWKIQIENSIDLVHPPLLHANAIAASKAFEREVASGRDVPVAVDVFMSNGLSFDQFDDIRIFALDRGHCYMQGFLQKSEAEVAEDERFGSDDQMRFPTQAKYKQLLVEKHGRDKADEILAFNRHNTIIYPNLFINPRIQQLRVLHPTAVDRTEQHCYVFRLKGAPPEALETAVAFLTASNSPSSIATTDDHEVFERIQRGLFAGTDDWLDMSRGLGQEAAFDGGATAEGTNELLMRNQHKAWAEYMVGAA